MSAKLHGSHGITCLILGFGGLELLAAELRSLAGRGEGKLATREGEAGPQSTRKSQSKSLISPRAPVCLVRFTATRRFILPFFLFSRWIVAYRLSGAYLITSIRISSRHHKHREFAWKATELEFRSRRNAVSGWEIRKKKNGIKRSSQWSTNQALRGAPSRAYALQVMRKNLWKNTIRSKNHMSAANVLDATITSVLTSIETHILQRKTRVENICWDAVIFHCFIFSDKIFMETNKRKNNLK